MPSAKIFPSPSTLLVSPLAIDSKSKEGIHPSEVYAELRLEYFAGKKTWYLFLTEQSAADYYPEKFVEAYAILASLDESAASDAKQKKVQNFLKLCLANPDILLLEDTIHGEGNLFKAFLEKCSLFEGEFADFYRDSFKRLLSAAPTTHLGGVSVFDAQDAYGFNLLCHLVNTEDVALIEAYLQHPRVKALMNYNFVDSVSLFNVFCLVYAKNKELSRVLTENGVHFTIDHLLGVFHYVKSGHLASALHDFQVYRKDRRLNEAQYKALIIAVAAHPALLDEMLETGLSALNPSTSAIRLKKTTTRLAVEPPGPFYSILTSIKGSKLDLSRKLISREIK